MTRNTTFIMGTDNMNRRDQADHSGNRACGTIAALAIACSSAGVGGLLMWLAKAPLYVAAPFYLFVTFWFTVFIGMLFVLSEKE